MTVALNRLSGSNPEPEIPLPASDLAADGATVGASSHPEPLVSGRLDRWLPAIVSVPLPVALIVYFIVRAILAAP